MLNYKILKSNFAWRYLGDNALLSAPLAKRSDLGLLQLQGHGFRAEVRRSVPAGQNSGLQPVEPNLQVPDGRVQNLCRVLLQCSLQDGKQEQEVSGL